MLWQMVGGGEGAPGSSVEVKTAVQLSHELSFPQLRRIMGVGRMPASGPLLFVGVLRFLGYPKSRCGLTG